MASGENGEIRQDKKGSGPCKKNAASLYFGKETEINQIEKKEAVSRSDPSEA